MSLPTYLWLTRVLWTPLSLAAWTLAWNRWCLRSSRAIDGATLVLAAVGVAGGAMQVMAMTRISRLGLLALLVLIVVRMVRGGPMRIMAVATMALILVAHFSGELRLDRHTGHLVSVRHRRNARAIRLCDRDTAAGFADRANLGFEKRSYRSNLTRRLSIPHSSQNQA